MEAAAVMGQTVDVRMMVSVTRTVDRASLGRPDRAWESAGQFVMVAAHEVMVRTEVANTVRVVSPSAAAVEALAGWTDGAREGATFEAAATREAGLEAAGTTGLLGTGRVEFWRRKWMPPWRGWLAATRLARPRVRMLAVFILACKSIYTDKRARYIWSAFLEKWQLTGRNVHFFVFFLLNSERLD